MEKPTATPMEAFGGGIPDMFAPRGHPEHDVLLYQDGAFPVADVARFAADGLHAGSGVAVVLRRERHEALRQALRDLGADGDDAARRGQLVLAEAEQTLSDVLLDDGAVSARAFANEIEPVLSRLQVRFGSVRIYGETVDLLCRDGNLPAALELERHWNALLRHGNFRLLCSYDLRSFDSAAAAERFGDICAEHMRVLPPGADAEVEGTEHAWRRVAAELAQKSRALRAEVERRRALEGERAGLVAATRRASSHLARLQRVTSALLGAQTMDDVGAVAVGTMAEALRASDALLAVAAVSGPALEPISRAGRFASAAAGPFAVDEHGPIARAWQTGRVEWLGPAGERRERLEALVVLPLDAAGRRVGALAFGFDTPQSITPADRALLEDLRRQVALAVDRARLLETAVRERARAEEASRAKDEFLAMLGHELRNPLSPMVTVLQLLRTRGESVFTREHAVLERQVGHMVRLVDDLLDVARVARGRLELKRRPTDLREAVDAALEAARPLVERAGHELGVELPERPLVVDADPERLAQVVTNLLTNAVKYTPPGGHVRLRAAALGATARLEVQDDGRGIDAALLPRVFQLFVQGRRDLDRAEGGLGLGLAIVRSIAELHGGRVEARSEGPGRGSTFIVELPLMAQRSLALPGPTAPRRPPSETGRRVLVVDDNADAADALGEALACFGHDVRVVHDAPAALHLARGFRPELALLDIGLPGMSGWELGERLRVVLGEAVRLVAVTGYGLDADRARSREAGFEAHLVKPVDLSLIESTVRHVLGIPGSAAATASAPSR